MTLASAVASACRSVGSAGAESKVAADSSSVVVHCILAEVWAALHCSKRCLGRSYQGVGRAFVVLYSMAVACEVDDASVAESAVAKSAMLAQQATAAATAVATVVNAATVATVVVVLIPFASAKFVRRHCRASFPAPRSLPSKSTNWPATKF